MHIPIVLSVFQLLAALPGHEGLFKNQKNTIFNGRFKDLSILSGHDGSEEVILSYSTVEGVQKVEGVH